MKFPRNVSPAALRRRLAALSLLALLMGLLTQPAWGTPANPPTRPYAPGEVLVKFKPGLSTKIMAQSLAGYNAQAQFAPELAKLGYLLLTVPDKAVLESVSALQQNPLVETAEPNYLVQIADTIPNDPSWNLQYGLPHIQAPQAWDVTTGTLSVTIAIIDTGVDITHPDLATQIWSNSGEQGLDANGNDKRTNKLDDDGNGYIDDWRGWDFVNSDNNPQDDHSHGTHVAGIAAAATNNGVGIAGMAWGARILALKILASNGYGTDSNLARAMVYATDLGVQILNLSLGDTVSSTVMGDATRYAYAHGALVVAAAGNQGANSVLYPAAFSQAIAVAAVDTSNLRPYFSNYGPEVDVAAPGTSIYSTYPVSMGSYGYKSGTSMATPYVAGVAALLAGQPLFNTPDKIRAALQNTTLDLGTPGWDAYYGFGLVQAADALWYEQNPPKFKVYIPFFSPASYKECFLPLIRR